MNVVRGIENLSQAPVHSVITIGNFDGVHLGHQKIVGLAVEKARERGGVAVAYTFRPHPQVALRPGSGVQLLSTYEEKADLIRKLGVDLFIEEPFSREFSTIEPTQFFSNVLLRRLNVEAVVVGYDFAFGKERSGQLSALEALCKDAGVELTVVPPQRVGGEVVSSSKIRQFLLNGETENAARLLGRNFSYSGVVVKGEGRGRKLGFPTANLTLPEVPEAGDKLALPYGVYASWAVFQGRRFGSVTNVGVRPTFFPSGQNLPGGLPALVETHLLDTTVDLYGSVIEVEFVSRLRGEQRFSGVDALKVQIAQDILRARPLLT